MGTHNGRLIKGWLTLALLLASSCSIEPYQSPSTTTPVINPSTATPPVLTSTAAPTFTPSATSIMLPSTITPKKINTPTKTFNPFDVPTAIPAHETFLVQLLHQEECRLPCYLGITPGITSQKEAELILNKIGATFVSSSTHGEFTTYGYRQGIGDPLAPPQTELSRMINGESAIIHGIVMTVNKEIVQGLDISVFMRRPTLLAWEYWQEYSLDRIFSYLGIPDRILVSLGYYPAETSPQYSLFLEYDTTNITIFFYSKKKGERLCLGINEESYTSFNLDIWILPEALVNPSDKVVNNIDNVLGITREEFYNRTLADPAACFDRKETSSP